MNNFAELSGCVFSWIEDYCKPGDLQEMLNNILRKVDLLILLQQALLLVKMSN